MLERTYRAAALGEAMARAKRDLGPGAMIVSVRELGGRTVELTAGAPIDESDAPRSLSGHLESAGVPASAARSLARRVYELAGDVCAADARAELAIALSEQLTFARRGGREPRVLVLAGPTGVGKTTTIAKLAAHAALVERKHVALVCMDGYRIGASEQLARYADLIGVPMRCAWDGPMLARTLADLADAELVLVDTEGRSPKDPGAVTRLAQSLARAGEPVSVHLCVAAATRPQELRRIADVWSALGCARLGVTKVDEAIGCGGIVAAHAESGLPLAWLTTGQRVPEDLEVASPERIASLLCNEEDA